MRTSTQCPLPVELTLAACFYNADDIVCRLPAIHSQVVKGQIQHIQSSYPAGQCFVMRCIIGMRGSEQAFREDQKSFLQKEV